MVGNSSSGIIEAASFGLYVLNVGGRQQGRECSANVTHNVAEVSTIADDIRQMLTLGRYAGENIYYQRDACRILVDKLAAAYQTPDELSI